MNGRPRRQLPGLGPLPPPAPWPSAEVVLLRALGRALRIVGDAVDAYADTCQRAAPRGPDATSLPLREAATCSGISAERLRRAVQHGALEGGVVGRGYVVTYPLRWTGREEA